MAHVSAQLVDESTLDVEGVLFVRKDDDEVLLRPMTKAVAPRLACSACGFERAYTFWFKRLDFVDRTIEFCPGCGRHIIGVAAGVRPRDGDA